MKKLNQKGFETLTVIGLVVILALVSGIGWYVWSKRDTAADRDNSFVVGNTKDKKTENNDVEKDEYAGWKSYERYGVSFKYPSDWSLDAQDNSQSQATFLKSADYSYPEDAPNPYPTTGGMVTIDNAAYFAKGLTADNFEQNFLKKNPNPNKNFKVLTINGNKALRYQYDDPSSGIETDFFLSKDKFVQFHFDYSINDQEVLAVYEKIVSSVSY